MTELLTPHETAFDPANDERWWGRAALRPTCSGDLLAPGRPDDPLGDTNSFNIRLIRFLFDFMLCSSKLSAVGG
jgi:hypothetical protein